MEFQVAIIGLVSAVVVALISTVGNILSNRFQNEKTIAVVQTRLDMSQESYKENNKAIHAEISELRSEMKKYNNLQERMVRAELDAQAQWRKIDDHDEMLRRLMMDNDRKEV